MSIRATVWAMRCLLPADPIKQPLWRLTLILAAEHVQDCGDGFFSPHQIALVSGRTSEDVIDDFVALSRHEIAELRQTHGGPVVVFGMPDRDMQHDSCPVTAGGRRGSR